MHHESTITEITHARPGGYRELILIAWPLVLSSGTQSLQHVVDRILLNWFSQDAMAASLPAGILFWSVLSLPFGTLMYVNAFVAQYEGAGRQDRVLAAIWQGVYFALITGFLLMLLAPFSWDLFRWIGHGDSLAVLEAEYFFWLMLGMPAALLSAVLSTFYSGRGQTNVVLWVNGSGVLVNIVLDVILIFGWGQIPALGMAGAAMATSVASVYATIVYAVLLSLPRVSAAYGTWKNWKFDLDLSSRLLKFGFPSGLQMFLDVAGFTVFMFVIGWIGTRELAASNLAFNLNTLAFIPVHGIGIAVSTLVGQRIGEGKPDIAEKSVWRGFTLAGGYMLFCGLVYIGLPDLLIAPYGIKAKDPAEFAATRDLVIVLLRFVAFYSFCDAMAIIFGAAIRAAGDTRFSLMVTVGCSALLLVLPTFLTWKFYGPDLYLCWIFCCIYVIGMGVCYWARFRQGKWKQMSVIEPEAQEAATQANPHLTTT